MGGAGSSLFYPDNPRRRDRAEQLKNDCENAKNDYESARKDLAAQLEPLHGQLDDVLKAVGCTSLVDLDEMVLKTATGQALEDWKKVRDAYHIADQVEGVIWASCGIIALAGFSLSVLMGIFSFGIGFVAGVALTSTITAILGVIGLIYDAINGAIQRDKLREAIKKLFVTRLKITRLADRAKAMHPIVPVIIKLYEAIKSTGIQDKKKIEDIIMGVKSSIQIDQQQFTYHAVAESLNKMDKSRSSWTDEDPDWKEGADFEEQMEMIDNIVDQWMSILEKGEESYYSSPTIPQPRMPSGGGSGGSVSPDMNKEVTTYVGSDYLQEARQHGISVVITPVNYPGGADGPLRFLYKDCTLRAFQLISPTSASVLLTVNEGGQQLTWMYILHQLDSGNHNDVKQAYADVALYQPDKPMLCVLPNGHLSKDSKAGTFRIKYSTVHHY